MIDDESSQKPPPSIAEERVFQLGAVVRRAMQASYQMLTQEAQEGVRQAIDGRALVQLLLDKGIITPEEVAEARRSAEREITAERAERWKGPWLTTRTDDPEASVDCATRHEHCRATCCSFYRVYLTPTEVQRGELQWDLAIPYALPRGPDGRCAYLDITTLGCRVWQNRPWVCRTYTCAHDTEIWVDFENMVPTERVRDLTRARRAEARAAAGVEPPIDR